MLELFEHHDAGALAHDETVAVAVIGTRCRSRRVVAAVESALQAANPASEIRLIGASAPPATITSASPSAINRLASPMACAPVEQAVTTAWFGPRSLCGSRPGPSQVDQASGNEERRNAARTASRRVYPPRRCLRSRRYRSRSARRSRSGLHRFAGCQPASFERLVGGRHAEQDEGIDLALFLGLHPVVGIEGAVGPSDRREPAGDLRGHVADIEFGDAGRAAFAGDQAGPGISVPLPKGETMPMPVTTTRASSQSHVKMQKPAHVLRRPLTAGEVRVRRQAFSKCT
jgi:hypothetical protein